MTASDPAPCAGDIARAFDAAERAGHRTFLLDHLGALSYGETCVRIRKLAGWLRAWDLPAGARVLLATREDRSTAVAFLTLLRCGHPVLLLDPASGPERARRLLEVGEPEAFLVDRDLIEPWGLAGRDRLLAFAPEARPGALEAHPAARWAGRETYPACLKAMRPAELPAAPDPGTDAYVLFTSGTTAAPKGACITQAALFAHLGSLGRAFGYDPDCRLFNNLPLSHADGLVQGPAIAFSHGLRLLRPFPFQIQTLDELFDVLVRQRATHLVATPTMLALLERYAAARRETLGDGLRFVISCSAALETELWRRFEARFQVPVANLYGLTETVTGGLLAGPGDRRHGTVGRPLDCEARIVDAAGRVCPDLAAGELQLRGSLLMRGYLGDPAASAEVLDPQGWLRTGDVAERDPDGCYRILGRRKAMIVHGGSKVHPEEVTEVLDSHPGVLEAVTFGVADPLWGEQVVSAVVAVPGVVLDPAGLVGHCRARLEAHKVPSRIVFLPGLARGRSGKVLLEQVRTQVAALGTAVAAGAGTAGGELRAGVLEEASLCFRVPPEILDLGTTPLSCPGWDSMAHLGFIAGLETRFGISLEPEDIVAIDSLGAAVRLLEARRVAQ